MSNIIALNSKEISAVAGGTSLFVSGAGYVGAGAGISALVYLFHECGFNNVISFVFNSRRVWSARSGGLDTGMIDNAWKIRHVLMGTAMVAGVQVGGSFLFAVGANVLEDIFCRITNRSEL